MENNKRENMRQLKQKDVKPIREQLIKKEGGVCPVSKLDITCGDACLDHAHEDSLHPDSETVEGQVRGVLHKYANALEGAWRSKFRRSGLNGYMSFEEALINMHYYLMNNRELYLHPSHAPGPRKLMKSSFNDLKRAIIGANKFLEKPIKVPDFPKSGRCTKRICELFDMFGIYPKYYGKK
jgi:hypothetical protein